MLQNYVKIAVRNLFRNKAYSLINIMGLSLGVACCLLLTLYIQDEYNYDRHHQRLEDLYRITTLINFDKGQDKMGTTSPPIAMTLWDEIPEIESAARVLNPPGESLCLIQHEDKLFYETDGLIADSTLFEIFTYEFIEGNPKRSLVNPNSVVISDKMARKLFGNEPALNQVIKISQGNTADYKVTGVFKSSANSHLHANFFTSMTSAGGMAEYISKDPEATGEWAGQNFVPAYVKLVPGHNRQEVVRKMNEVLTKYGAEDMKAIGLYKELGLEPVEDIYLKSDIGKSPRISYIYVIASIAIFILLIACINFMNLSTAKATRRAAEIGIRKVMGAFRSSLISQILGEAMVIVLLSILISVVLVQTSLPYFNEVTGKNISFQTDNFFYFIGALAVIAIITGLVAGSYPAFYLSSFQPAQVLKGKFSMANASGLLRRSLVVFQFMIAITLVCGMIIISRQLKYMQEKDLGFDSHAKLVIPMRTKEAKGQHEAFKQQLEKNSDILAVSATEYLPGSTVWSDMMFYSEGGNMDNAILHRRNLVDFGYPEMMNIKIIAGRSFTNNRAVESNRKVIVNRTSTKKLGITPEDIVGQHIYFDWQGKKYDYEVIGVMEDYHQQSLKEAINPMMFEMSRDSSRYSYVVATVNTSHLSETIAQVERNWKSLVSDTPFEYSFLDEDLREQYEEDQKVSSIITSFTVMAMLISCLGLYGLSSFMAERRFKEIGVRKVMGASVNQILGLMSTEFVKLVLIAFVLAVPLAWYTMDQWLQGFAYRIVVGPAVFLLAGAGALLIALLTVTYESLRAASVNPVDTLRNE